MYKEVEAIVKSLKNGKSCGTDGISSELLKYGGPSVIVWLKQPLPGSCLCTGVIIPIYKGKGRSPLDPNSYRGITLTSKFNVLKRSYSTG